MNKISILKIFGVIFTLLLISNVASAVSSVDQGFQAGWFVGDGKNLTNLNATQMINGVLAVANGGTGASTAAGARNNLNITNITNVKDYGAVGNGVTDDITAIQNAIDSLGNNGGIVYFPPGNYSISSAIRIGDGTEAAKSTKNRIVLKGDNIGSTSDAEIIDTPQGTVKIFWNGATGGTMLYINGSTYGNGIIGLYFDANGKASTALNVTHTFSSVFENIKIAQYTGIAIDLSAYDNPQGGVVTGANQNTWMNIITINPVGAAAGGIRIGSSDASASPYLAVSQNSFTNMQLTRSSDVSAPASITLRFTDANVFINVLASAHGGTAVGKALEIIPPVAKNQFPQGISFYNCPMLGTINVTGTWTPTLHKIAFIPFMTGDYNATIPQADGFMGIYDSGSMFGISGLGGAGDVAAHAASNVSASVHPNAENISRKNVANGYVGLDVDGMIGVAFPNARYLQWKDGGGTPKDVMTVNAAGTTLIYGYGDGFYVYNSTATNILNIAQAGTVFTLPKYAGASITNSCFDTNGGLYKSASPCVTITSLGTITTGTWSATDVAVAAGGTGASDAATARTNLGASPTAGSSSITTVGTIGSGIWQGTPVADAYIASTFLKNPATSNLDMGTGDVILRNGKKLSMWNTGSVVDGAIYEDASNNMLIGGTDAMYFYNTDWSIARLGINSAGATTIAALAGTGNAYVCVNSAGTLYRSATACV